ncbi:MAG: hypothetical protein N2053_07605 [Chitinispirillaceae bacterium]|nr:hypothetical protein [Chitinispirillaceae bacterium]
MMDFFRKIKVRIIPNKRLKRNWYVKFLRDKKKYELNIPPILETAPEEIKRALLEWVNVVADNTIRWNKSLKIRRRELEQKIVSFISENCKVISQTKKVPSPKWITKGCKYDLMEIFNSLNQRFFNNTIISFVRWGRDNSRTSYQKRCKLADGSFYNLITIAGIYNKPDVPQYAIESIIFHEMLHIYIPPVKKNGRNIIHSAEFRRMEKAFPYYSLWKEWLKKEIIFQKPIF